MKQRFALNLHASFITALSISANGQFITSAAHDGTVRVTNIHDDNVFDFGGHHHTMGRGNCAPKPHGTPFVLADFLPQARQFLTVDERGRVVIRTYPKGASIKSYSLRSGLYHAFAISPDGKLLAGGAYASGKESAAKASGGDSGEPDKNLRLWSLDTGKEIWAAVHGYTTEKIPYDWGEADCECSVLAVAFSPDGRFLASAGDDATLLVWDSDSHVHSQTLRVEYQKPKCIAFSPDGAFIAVGGSGRSQIVSVYNIQDASLSWYADDSGWVKAVSFSPDGSLVASLHTDNTIRLWDSKNGTPHLSQPAHAMTPTAIAYVADGKALATGGADGVVIVWDLER